MKSYLFFLLFFPYCLTIHNSNQCSIEDSCSNSSLRSPSVYNDERFIQSRNCFCDSVCEEYNDCCNHSRLSHLNKYECIDYLSPVNNNKIILFNPLFIWMRTQCLTIYIGSRFDIQCRNLNNQIFKENPLLYIPVTSLQTHITYRNYYCAHCNNDANVDIQFWEYKAFCRGNTSNDDYVILNKEEQFNYYIDDFTRTCTKAIIYPHIKGTTQPSVFIRPCKNSLPPMCPLKTPIDLARNCSLSSTAYRYDTKSNIIYHNPYCAECNNKNTNKITCSDPKLRSALPPISQIYVHPLSILFDPNLLKRINNNSTTQMIYSLNYNCTKSTEFYNLFSKTCSQLLDSPKEIIISMACSYPMQTTEDHLQYNNGSLYLTHHSILLTRDQYVFLNDKLIIYCADQWNHPKPTFPFYRNILSIICTFISLVCLIIFVVAFSLIPSLHNLPGKCLLLLSLSIFLGQFIFLSTSNLIQHSSLCLISSILIHFFYLSSFIWLLIIAIDIHSTFNRQRISNEENSKDNSRLLIYNILVWCSSGIIILIACFIQFKNPQSSFAPNYGLLFCSISKANAMIVFFLLPIACLLGSVLILFIKTILAIHHSHRIAKLASTSSSYSLVFVYIRLASLMGLQWILLVIALVIQQTWLWIIFEIINSLPGVFICLGFLCSQRLWSNIKQKISQKLVIRRQSSRSNTAATSVLMSPSSQPINTKKKFLF